MLSFTWVQGILENEADFLEKINILNSVLALKCRQTLLHHIWNPEYLMEKCSVVFNVTNQNTRTELQ